MKAFILLLLLMPYLASGQEEIPPKYLRFIPLGEVPLWREEIRDGRRIQSLPKPGEMPPNVIQVNGGNYNGVFTRLFLGRLTDYFSVKGEQERLEISEHGGEPIWINSPMPAATHTLAILFRDLQEMTWLKPMIKIVRDDLQAFPLESMRFVNVSHLEIAVRIGGEAPMFIKPGESKYQKLEVGSNNVSIDAISPDGGSNLAFQNDIPMKKGRRVQSFVFKPQNPAASRYVRFSYQVEQFESPQSLFKSKRKSTPKPEEVPVERDNS